MRVRELILVAAIANAACIHANPDRRATTVDAVQRTGFGAWIVLTTTAGEEIQGELISVEPNAVSVMAFTHDAGFRVVPKREIRGGKVYEYKSQGGFGVWGALGTLSTLSHGFVLVLSAPVWLATAGIVAAVESGHVVLELAPGNWAEVAMWARFPQGMPPGFGAPGARDPLWSPPAAPGAAERPPGLAPTSATP